MNKSRKLKGMRPYTPRDRDLAERKLWWLYFAPRQVSPRWKAWIDTIDDPKLSRLRDLIKQGKDAVESVVDPEMRTLVDRVLYKSASLQAQIGKYVAGKGRREPGRRFSSPGGDTPR